MQQCLCILLIQSAVVSAIRFELAVELDIAHHHPGMAPVHGHPQLPLPQLPHLEHGLRIPSLEPKKAQKTNLTT
jgi:hypothetical protein